MAERFILRRGPFYLLASRDLVSCWTTFVEHALRMTNAEAIDAAERSEMVDAPEYEILEVTELRPVTLPKESDG